MREIIIPALIINLLMFIMGVVMGINPSLVTISNPGGYVFQLQLNYSILGASLGGMVIAAAFIGIKVLGSGLTDTSVAMINNILIHSVAWAILSSVSYAYLWQIPTFGIIIYAALSIMYAFGVFIGAAGVLGSGSEGTSAGDFASGGGE